MYFINSDALIGKHRGVYRRLETVKGPEETDYSKQPIMRTEDRLFDRGWVRSAMATRKCGKKLFSEILYGRQAVFYEDFFSRIIWVGGVQKSP